MITDANDPVSMDHTNRDYSGLTKREYFAAQALVGLISSHSHPSASGSTIESCPNMTKHAVDYADALINELNKE